MTVFDLEETELAHAPQYGSAKDPINMAGFLAGGLLRGEHPQVDVEAVLAAPADQRPFVVDVRTPREYAAGQAQEMYRKFKDIQFGMIGPKALFDALELLTAVQALNQARVAYLQQVVEFNRSQFRLYTSVGQSAVCRIDSAALQPLNVPVIPPTPPNPDKKP